MRCVVVGLVIFASAALASPVAASDGMWSASFYGLRKCSVLGKLRYGPQYYAFGFSWTESKSVVEFTIAEMNGTLSGAKKPQLSIESPSLDKPWLPIVGFAEFHASPEADSLRRDIANDAPWKLITTPKRGAPTVLHMPASNGRTQMAMFDACLAATAKFPNIDIGPPAPPGHWSASAEVGYCEGYAKFPFANTELELLVEVSPGVSSVFSRIINPAVAAANSIDLKAIGGPRLERGARATFTRQGQASADLLTKLWAETAAVTVVDADGQSTSIPLVAPQDVVDFAMFRGCVASLEPSGP